MPTDPMWCFENYGEAAEYIDQLEKQRDELLAALKDAWFTLDKLRTASNGEQRRYAVSFAGNTIHVAPILEAIKDAIAKAEG